MNSIVALPLAGTPILTGTAAFDADAELVDLASRIRLLHEATHEAYNVISECDERFNAIEPEKPKALIWRCDWDLARSSSDEFVDEEGRRWAYVNFEDVDKLRGREFLEHSFLGSDEEWDRLDFHTMGGRVVPLKGHEHLFSSKPDERTQRRAKQLIDALDEYRAQYALAEEQSGMKAADDALNRIFSEQSELCERMLTLKPTSLRGLQALATALVYNCWGGEIEDYPKPTEEDLLVTAIIRSLAEPSLAA